MPSQSVTAARRVSPAAGFALAAGAGLAILFTGTPVKAADPGFSGTWADDISQCKTEQDVAGAPMIVTKRGYDQHETHCTFKSVKEIEAGAWKVVGACSVEGGEQSMDLTLTVSGDTLTMSDEGGARDLLRCP